MNWTFLKNDCKQNKFISILLLAFITVAATLLSCCTSLFLQLSKSTTAMMEDAKTPHFMQMHSGELHYDQLLEFSQTNPDVTEFQVQGFLNLEGSEFVFKKGSLGNSMMDNGVCVQGAGFDYLLNYAGGVIEVQEGEIYIPDTYRKEFEIVIGDSMEIAGVPFIIKGTLCDSQMNSSLASSKRFLINEADYERLLPMGKEEYLIEFRGTSEEVAAAIESAYAQAGLDANGPAITYPLFQMINAISDGLMVAILLIISMVLVVISFLCIRFTLLSRLAEDHREIGMMRAIGLTHKEIASLYQYKYQLLSGMGCMIGAIAATVFRQMLLENIIIYLGRQPMKFTTTIIQLCSGVTLYLVIILYTKNVLRKIKRVSVVSAMRGENVEKLSSKWCATRLKSKQQGIRLSKIPWMNPNLLLGLQDVLINTHLYLTMFVVILLIMSIALLPQNVYSTISSDSFIQFMGVGKCDIRIDLQQLTDLNAKAEEIKEYLSNVGVVEQYQTSVYPIRLNDRSIQNMKIETGNYEAFPITYSEGSSPLEDNEIALSYLNAEELDVHVGDKLAIISDGNEVILTICGIYSDITNGGKTAKATFSDDAAEPMSVVLCISLVEGTDTISIADELREQFPYAKISPVEEYIHQTMGNTMDKMFQISVISIIIAVLMSFLITALFVRMLITKDRVTIARMQAMGLFQKEIVLQYVSRTIIVTILGIGVGTIIANTVGLLIARVAITKIGVTNFTFHTDSLINYFFNPLVIVLVVGIATMIGAGKMKSDKMLEHIREGV